MKKRQTKELLANRTRQLATVRHSRDRAINDMRQLRKQLAHLGDSYELKQRELSESGATIANLTHDLHDARLCATRRAREITIMRVEINAATETVDPALYHLTTQLGACQTRNAALGRKFEAEHSEVVRLRKQTTKLRVEINEIGGINIAGLEYQVHEAQSQNVKLQKRLTEALAQIDTLCQVTDDSPNKVKALEMAGGCWSDAETSGITMNTQLAEAFAKRIEPMLTAIDEAWAIIFHASWSNANGEWRKKAREWRDRNSMAKVVLAEDQDTEGNAGRARVLADKCFDDSDAVLDNRLRTLIAQSTAKHIEPLLDAIEEAWGLLANSYGGNWSKATDEWRAAMERWRGKYVGM